MDDLRTPIAPSSAPVSSAMPRWLKLMMMAAGAVIVAVVAFGGTFLVMFLRHPKGRQIAHAVGESLRVVAAGHSAPGAAELRQAGCMEATVFDWSRVAKATDTLDPKSGLVPTFGAMEPTVVCAVQSEEGAPACEELARVYGGAASASEFELRVTTGPRRELCSGVYDASGRRLRDARTHRHSSD